MDGVYLITFIGRVHTHIRYFHRACVCVVKSTTSSLTLAPHHVPTPRASPSRTYALTARTQQPLRDRSGARSWQSCMSHARDCCPVFLMHADDTAHKSAHVCARPVLWTSRRRQTHARAEPLLCTSSALLITARRYNARSPMCMRNRCALSCI